MNRNNKLIEAKTALLATTLAIQNVRYEGAVPGGGSRGTRKRTNAKKKESES